MITQFALAIELRPETSSARCRLGERGIFMRSVITIKIHHKIIQKDSPHSQSSSELERDKNILVVVFANLIENPISGGMMPLKAHLLRDGVRALNQSLGGFNVTTFHRHGCAYKIFFFLYVERLSRLRIAERKTMENPGISLRPTSDSSFSPPRSGPSSAEKCNKK